MGFKVQTYSNRASKGAVDLGQVHTAAPVEAAFQAPAADVLSAGSKAASNAASIVNEYAQKRQKAITAEKITNISNLLSGELENMQYSNEKDEKGISSGYLNRNGNDAINIAGDFESKFNSLYLKHTKNLTAAEIAAINKNIEPKYYTAKSRVSLHEAGQQQAVAKKSYETNKNLNISAATGMTDPKNLSMLIDSNNESAASFAQALGYSKNDLKFEQETAAGKIVAASINSFLSVDDIDGAKSMLEKMKNKVSGQEYQSIADSIKGKQTQKRYDNIWEESNTLRMGDGFIDLSAAYEMIQNKNDLTPAEKDSAYNYIKAKAGEDKMRVTQKRDSDDREFHNNLISSWREGKPLEETVKISAQYGFDDYDIWLKEEAVRRLYADPTMKSNPETLVRINEGLVSGNIDQGYIDEEFRSRNLNSSDWVNLRGQLNKTVMGVQNTTGAEAKIVLSYIDDYAESRFNNKAEKDQVKALLYSKVQGKSLVEAKKIIDDYTVKDGFLFFGSYKAEDEIKQGQSELSLQAKFVNEIPNGDAFVRGIIKDYTMQNKTVKEKDVQRIIDRYGIDNLNDPSQSEYQAVQALINSGKRITVNNIDFVINEILKRKK